MQTTLSTELYWLVLVVSFTALMWLPYIINRISELGILSAIWDPYGHTEAKAKWANRMMSAHVNAVENLMIFAPLVLVVQLTGASTETTATACAVYFFSRVGHFVTFTFAVPVLRIVSFLVGFSAQMILALTLLNVI